MKLINPDLLITAMAECDVSGAWLGRRAGVNRQYIWRLTSGLKDECPQDIVRKIEAALRVSPGSLFVANRDADTVRASIGSYEQASA